MKNVYNENEKIYQVIFQDEYNNLFLIGFFRNLNDAIAPLNSYLELYEAHIDNLSTYASTFSECFDQEIYTKDGEETGCIIRGFIFENKQEIEQLIK